MSPRPGRADDRSSASPRRGLLSGMSVAPMESMPRIRTAFARSLAATWSSPLIVGLVGAWLLVEWIVIVALGYPGPFFFLGNLSATPPLSTTTDVYISIGLFGRLGLAFVFGIAALHAILVSLLTGLVIEAIETGTASRWGAVRGLKAFPVAFAVRIIGVMGLILSELGGSFGGGGLALFVQLGVLVVVVWLFAFAPVIAVAEGRRLMDALGRSMRAARLPGSGNLSFAILYVFPVFATFLAPGVPGRVLDVSPPFTAWIFAMFMNLLHVAILGAIAFRYLMVADEVPDAPARPSRSRRPEPATRAPRDRRRS